MHGQPTHESANDQTPSQVKALIVEKARLGVFKHNPLLSTVHIITCSSCHHRQNIIYIDALKQGTFKVGLAEHIEVLDTSGPIGILETQQITPIIINVPCMTCGARITVRPISVEYLSILLEKPRPSRTMYA